MLNNAEGEQKGFGMFVSGDYFADSLFSLVAAMEKERLDKMSEEELRKELMVCRNCEKYIGDMYSTGRCSYVEDDLLASSPYVTASLPGCSKWELAKWIANLVEGAEGEDNE